MRYLIVIEKGLNSRGIESYSAFSPDVLGCATTGKTREEVERRMREALVFHLKGTLEDGDPIPEPHTLPSDPEIVGDPALTPIYMDIPIPHLTA
jgi:predicted RNase H-like HicB family nuclease